MSDFDIVEHFLPRHCFSHPNISQSSLSAHFQVDFDTFLNAVNIVVANESPNLGGKRVRLRVVTEAEMLWALTPLIVPYLVVRELPPS